MLAVWIFYPTMIFIFNICFCIQRNLSVPLTFFPKVETVREPVPMDLGSVVLVSNNDFLNLKTLKNIIWIYYTSCRVMWCHNKGELHLPCTGSHNRASWSWTVYLHNLQMLVQHLQDQIWFQCKIHFFKLLHEHLSSYWHIIFRHFKLQILQSGPQLYLEQQHQKLMAAALVIAYLTPSASPVLVAREHLWYVGSTLDNIVSITGFAITPV